MRNNVKSFVLLAITLCASICMPASTLCEESQLEQHIKAFSEIKSVTCSVRKTSDAGKNIVRMLSRVHFKKGGFIHVENVSPSRRRIIADGKKLYYYDSNHPKGFSRPVTELDAEWISSLTCVPASPMEHLLKMRALKEGSSAVKGSVTSTEYHGEKNHVLLTEDAEGRITSIAFFSDQAMSKRFGLYEYSDFVKADKTWLATTHKAEISLPDGTKAKETRRFDNLNIDTEIPPKLFDHKLFMPEVEFVYDFEKTWQ